MQIRLHRGQRVGTANVDSFDARSRHIVASCVGKVETLFVILQRVLDIGVVPGRKVDL